MYPLLKRVILSSSAITLLVVAGCGGTTTTTAPAGEGGVFTFGEPADPAQADRKIEILASDNLTFDPSAVEVTAGR